MKKKLRDETIELGRGFTLSIRGLFPFGRIRKGRNPFFLVNIFLINFVDHECEDPNVILEGSFSTGTSYDPGKNQWTVTLSCGTAEPAIRWRHAALDINSSADMVDDIFERRATLRSGSPTDGGWLDQVLDLFEEQDFVGALRRVHAHRLQLLASARTDRA